MQKKYTTYDVDKLVNRLKTKDVPGLKAAGYDVGKLDAAVKDIEKQWKEKDIDDGGSIKDLTRNLNEASSADLVKKTATKEGNPMYVINYGASVYWAADIGDGWFGYSSGVNAGGEKRMRITFAGNGKTGNFINREGNYVFSFKDLRGTPEIKPYDKAKPFDEKKILDGIGQALSNINGVDLKQKLGEEPFKTLDKAMGGKTSWKKGDDPEGTADVNSAVTNAVKNLVDRFEKATSPLCA